MCSGENFGGGGAGSILVVGDDSEAVLDELFESIELDAKTVVDGQAMGGRLGKHLCLLLVLGGIQLRRKAGEGKCR